MGNYAAAEPLYRQAVEIRRKILGEEHPDFASSLNNLAVLYRLMGNYMAAEPLFRESRDILRKVVGEKHPDFASSLTNLAQVYESIGNYAAAEPLYRQTLEIRRRILGEKHPDFAASLNNLAVLYKSTGNYAAAEPLYRQTLEIRRRILGEKHPNFANSLSNLAVLYHSMGNYAEAEPMDRQAMEIRREALGEEHPDFASSLNNLAHLYDSLGNYAAAEPLYRKALEIRSRVLGEEHPRFATSLNNLAGLYVATRRESEALVLMQQAIAIENRMIGQVFSISSENQRMAYISSIQRNVDAFLSLALGHLSDSAEAVHGAFDLVLRRKAVGIEALATQRDAVMGGKYPSLEPRLRELTTIRMQIARKTLAGPGVGGIEVHRKRLAEWNDEKERLEADLVRQIPEMNVARKLRTADRQAVALALPEGAALVDFVRFRVFDFKAVPARGEPEWKPARYLAFILRAGEPDDVHMIDLGEAEAIDQVIDTFRAGITGETESRGSQAAQAAPNSVQKASQGVDVRKAVFDPLLVALGGRHRLLIAPDGDLTRLPFEVLPTRDGSRLIDDYQISYLGSGRDVVRFRES